MNYCKLLAIRAQRTTSTQEPNVQNQRRFKHPDTIQISNQHVLDPKFNKGLGFSMEERQRLCINGLFPAAIRSMDEQVLAVRANFKQRISSISRYRYLRSLRSRHERLYFRFMSEYIEEVLPVVYTPTVGVAAMTFGMIFRNPMGLFVSKFDRGQMLNVLTNWPEKDIRAICVTDGERILGLGDLGANGMGISVGKLELYTALGHVHPQRLVPIVLDVGTENKELLNDPMYIGIRDRRLRGQEYDDFVQEFMEAVVTAWGPNTLIHFEDFATPNAFKILEKYRQSYFCFNDDIQGTAATGLAGFLVVERATEKPLNEHVIIFVGAGSAATGIAALLYKELLNRGLNEEESVKNIYLIDAEGLLTKERKDLMPQIQPFAKDMKGWKTLEETVENLKPSIMLGATGISGLFTEKVLRTMATHHDKPAVFALSNPTNKSECTAEQVYCFTEGRAIFCSGSPFPPVLINERRIEPAQANNCFAFPGVGLGVICAQGRHIPDELFLVAAHTLADYVSEERIESGAIYPSIKEAPSVAFDIGVAVAQFLFDSDLSTVHPKPENVCEFVKGQLYKTLYGDTLAPTWEYPQMPKVKLAPQNEEECEEEES